MGVGVMNEWPFILGTDYVNAANITAHLCM